MHTEENDNELSAKQAATLLSLSPMTLKKWRCTEEHPELPWYKRFGKVFYLESEVRSFKEQSTLSSEKDVFI
ncbi:hypothetical protein R50073_50930 (plasmid) [Maricurvus nonylphenolicus]|uniref:hypothetical protein n=1 Tax=Maricurvus nonylphenolicus TaxID=1008307 RepID=UPI0036F3A581